MSHRPRRRVLAALAAASFALLVGACSISTEEQPRPITRETTVPTPAPNGP